MCGIRFVGEREVRVPVLCVMKGVWWSEGSECLFCVWNKMCGGVRGQSACFVCGVRCVVE